MAGLRACVVALALTTSNGFAPSLQTGAARGRPSPKSHWRLRSEHFQRVDAAARHRFVQMKLCARLRRAGPSRGGRFHAGAPPCLDGVAARHRRAVRATGVRTKTPSTRPRRPSRRPRLRPLRHVPRGLCGDEEARGRRAQEEAVWQRRSPRLREPQHAIFCSGFRKRRDQTFVPREPREGAQGRDRFERCPVHAARRVLDEFGSDAEEKGVDEHGR